ncbi:MAG: lipopolysaccharide biosynthesis protein [Bacteroidia bacterium]
MNPLKKLAGQTAIYGLSTILPRFLNYLLVPLLTYIFNRPVDYGINTEIYAYISFVNIIFTYGMETAFFNFASKAENKDTVYSTALISVLGSTLSLSLILLLFSGRIAGLMGYEDHVNYITWSIFIIATDALMAIPFARLRLANRAKRFAFIKLMNVFINVFLNVFYFVICKQAYEENIMSSQDSFLANLYNPHIGIGYAFLANLIANLICLLLLGKEFTGIPYTFDKALWKKMMSYALPLLIVGLAGMINETFDRIILKYLLPEGIGQAEVGIYGACYKISILMTMFIQAFKFAAEPFFFSNVKNEDSQRINALVMKYFAIGCSFLFLATMMNISWIQHFISAPYRVGIHVVPILLLANLFLGIYYNLSIWFKLTGQTRYGAYITIVGAIVTLAINFTFIPRFSYTASAWATFFSYGIMMVLSYYLGKKHYPVKYNLRNFFFFFTFAVLFYFISLLYKDKIGYWPELVINNSLVLIYCWLFYKLELPNLRKVT